MRITRARRDAQRFVGVARAAQRERLRAGGQCEHRAAAGEQSFSSVDAGIGGRNSDPYITRQRAQCEVHLLLSRHGGEAACSSFMPRLESNQFVSFARLQRDLERRGIARLHAHWASYAATVALVVHWLTDIFAGAAVGFIWLSICLTSLRFCADRQSG